MSRPQPPWWIRGDEELCSSCAQPYASGAGHRCADCDAELCALCAFLDLDDPFCSDCCDEAKAKKSEGRR